MPMVLKLSSRFSKGRYLSSMNTLWVDEEDLYAHGFEVK